MRNCGVILACFACLSLVGPHVAVRGENVGLTQNDVTIILAQVPLEAPIVYFRCVNGVLQDQRVVVVATDLYFTGPKKTRAAKVYIFTSSTRGWSLAFQTDMDERLAAQGLPADWEISLSRIEFADVDGDGLKEIIVFWNSEPSQSISLTQFQTILHIFDYSQEEHQFYEATAERLVYNTFRERAFLLNVDCDPEIEIVMFEEIWVQDTCVVCAKPYRVEVWTFQGGKFCMDPSWNKGQALETDEFLSLQNPCDFAKLLRDLVLRCYLSP